MDMWKQGGTSGRGASRLNQTVDLMNYPSLREGYVICIPVDC